MPRELPARADLEHLKKQAKRLLAELKDTNAAAKLADAQHAIAKQYGFVNWTALKEHVEAAATRADPWRAMEQAIRDNSTPRVRTLLTDFPALKTRLNDALPSYGFGATPLIAATHFKNRETIELLLDSGADVNQRSHWWAGGFGVLDDDRGFADFFIARGAIVDANAAAKLNRLDRLKEIVAADPEAVHARGGDGQTPLHVARSVEAAEFLLDHGADIDAIDVDHESTAAQYLIRSHQDIVRVLVARGCRTDILIAAALGDVDLVRRHLATNPASIRTTVNKTWFPMSNPRAGGTIYTWTLSGGATPHTIAREFGHEDVLKVLMDASPAEVQMAQACELGDDALFRKLLAVNPGVARALSPEDAARLVSAAERNNGNAIRLMLSAGWPSEARDVNGATALHYAAWHGNAEAVREILRHRAPLEVHDQPNNATPVNWAIHGSEHSWSKGTGDYAAVVDALLTAGAVPPGIPDEYEASEAMRSVLAKHGV